MIRFILRRTCRLNKVRVGHSGLWSTCMKSYTPASSKESAIQGRVVPFPSYDSSVLIISVIKKLAVREFMCFLHADYNPIQEPRHWKVNVFSYNIGSPLSRLSV